MAFNFSKGGQFLFNELMRQTTGRDLQAEQQRKSNQALAQRMRMEQAKRLEDSYQMESEKFEEQKAENQRRQKRFESELEAKKGKSANDPYKRIKVLQDMVPMLKEELETDPDYQEYINLVTEAEQEIRPASLSSFSLGFSEKDKKAAQKSLSEFLSNKPRLSRKIRKFENVKDSLSQALGMGESRPNLTGRDKAGLPMPLANPDQKQSFESVARDISSLMGQLSPASAKKVAEKARLLGSDVQKLSEFRDRIQAQIEKAGVKKTDQAAAAADPVVTEQLKRIDSSKTSKGSKRRQVEKLVSQNREKFETSDPSAFEGISKSVLNLVQKTVKRMARSAVDDLNQSFEQAVNNSSVFRDPARRDRFAKQKIRQKISQLLKDKDSARSIRQGLGSIDPRIRELVKQELDKMPETQRSAPSRYVVPGAY